MKLICADLVNYNHACPRSPILRAEITGLDVELMTASGLGMTLPYHHAGHVNAAIEIISNLSDQLSVDPLIITAHGEAGWSLVLGTFCTPGVSLVKS